MRAVNRQQYGAVVRKDLCKSVRFLSTFSCV
jgi:hypothetical protein